jgi:hypothetical protein
MTHQHLKHPSDPDQLAKSTIDRVTGQQPSPIDTRDPAAVALGRKDGIEELAHAPLTPEQRAEIAKKATKK